MFGKRLVSVGMSALLAAALCPAVAVAAPLEAGTLQPQPAKSGHIKNVTPQSAGTAYIITKVVRKEPGVQNGTMGLTASYKYNSNGLIAQRATKQGTTNPIRTTYKWAYDKSNVIKKLTTGSTSMTFTAKSGKWKKGTCKWSSTDSAIESYTYKNGNISKCKLTTVYSISGAKQSYDQTYNFTYKDGCLTKQAWKTPYYASEYTYSYDKKGNLKTAKTSMSQRNYKNTYDKKTGLLKKRSETLSSNGATATTTFTYKKITVKSAALAKKIAAQQWAIINDNNNFALGGLSLH